ncbi:MULTISPECIES: 3-oxoacid CoA-transferase subunit B [unclassified Sporosarcina]|uniref:3-oxoacid CoA-transferase subunit B n=1 Tax=unclassified Sporosarcina TaxID=2647733 RepID=UPI000C164468|nr:MULTISPECIES: 3-oxoacid CoA-transferase subunit B [unclassified Sporosarcina]PIC98283.1 succinyl-CoA--3-ketoacid-CoA transferase [Sporosarcina sp. P29]PID04622.1 succinyl-CoA--3-ketoacid-CoA transferase [Sporosarcina sp. P30]PID07801.1 succinyl-CoA--3-ketoacid-CoA transferase [Sporosarcina sp. P31]PID10962.1 succinyl-CoA--3-ketoacid-CoA transferase [Sporosarcina sp. P32b]
MGNKRELIAKRAADELEPYSFVNLGIGIPTLVANYIDDGLYTLHTENGLLGVTSVEEKDIDPLIVNAGKLPVGEALGASYFSSADSFAMIRGGHIDVAILGALQIDSRGRIANWAIPGKDIIGVGGAMDLLEGAKKIIITTNHVANDGRPKLVDECTFPITSERVAETIITDLAVFKWQGDNYELVELMGDSTIEEVQANTTAFYTISNELLQEGKV